MNVTLALASPAVAVPIVGAPAGPLVDPADEVLIGMWLFYPIDQQLTIVKIKSSTGSASYTTPN